MNDRDSLTSPLQQISDARAAGLASLSGPRLTPTSTATAGRLLVNWATSGSTAAFIGLTPMSTSLQLSLSRVGNEHVVVIGSQHIDLTTLSNAPSVVADTTATGNFTIAHRGRPGPDRFNAFSSFVDQLSTYINATVAVVVVVALGTYDQSTNTLTASRILVLLTS